MDFKWRQLLSDSSDAYWKSQWFHIQFENNKEVKASKYDVNFQTADKKDILLGIFQHPTHILKMRPASIS